MRLHPEETEAGPWSHVDDDALSALLTRQLPEGRGVLLVDGRSGSGKSTFAERAATLLGGAVVHSDDLAWHHDPVAWDDLALEHVIAPWRRGEDVDHRPPGWVAQGRDGSVRVPADVRVLVLEGVGAGRASLAARADAVVWVQSDRVEARLGRLDDVGGAVPRGGPPVGAGRPRRAHPRGRPDARAHDPERQGRDGRGDPPPLTRNVSAGPRIQGAAVYQEVGFCGW
ncbi:hypothetical protein [Terrabacter carboxydivorans]|uniref:Uridine kinase n=1 Tax=Terrabacter carboxydivorans TaxID=619730 RepID=A0ABN3M3X2_9MICO